MPLGGVTDDIESTVPGATGWEVPVWRRALAGRSAQIGLVALGFIILVSIAAPLIIHLLGVAPPNRQSFAALSTDGNPTGPSWLHPLGVDPLGRDVLSPRFVRWAGITTHVHRGHCDFCTHRCDHWFDQWLLRRVR